MKVLKFGSTSVANAENIKRVLDIVQQEDTCTVVVSALGGVTDRLLYAMEQAAQANQSYKEVLQELRIPPFRNNSRIYSSPRPKQSNQFRKSRTQPLGDPPRWDFYVGRNHAKSSRQSGEFW